MGDDVTDSFVGEELEFGAKTSDICDDVFKLGL